MTTEPQLDESLFEDENAPPEADKLATIVGLAEQMTALDADISKAEAHAKALKVKRDEIAEKLLPGALANAKMKSFELEDGRKIGLKDDLTISVPKKRLGEICDWLRKDNNGDMISNVVTIAVPKGKDNEVAQLQDAAAELGFEAERQVNVNATSLKALLNKKLKDGINVDLSFFGAFRLTRAVIEEK